MKHSTAWLLFIFAIGSSSASPAQAQSEGTRNDYSLNNVEKNPIPRDKHFRLWREVALQTCETSSTHLNLPQADCIRIVESRSETCAAQLADSVPVLVKTTDESKRIGRRFLNCATPSYFCGGAEIRSEEQARILCK